MGLVATVLFYVFRVEVYEVFFTAPGFSDQMYNHNIYGIITLITVATTWTAAGIYYYVINSVKFSRWYHWSCVLAIVTLITPIICYAVNNSIFEQNNLSYTTEAISLEFCNAIFSAAMFVIASFSIRWWSSNCRHTPIPQ